ncbi:MAG: EAL domain-containing protein [Nitrosomonas sp.]|nr:EAL domain-containing protein [Nitrosomonas sp.]MDP1951416.1 EAL domain-containing protein [Nitrosomonas sp.]
MNLRNNLLIIKKFWLVIVLFSALFISFSIYVHAEGQIDQVHHLRHTSYLLARELRQSSDDLTRMARTYVATGDSRYKVYYQDILDIRNGNKPRPIRSHRAYWDLVIAKGQLPPPDENEPAISLLDLMRQSGFADNELDKMIAAKMQSDALTTLELDAMKLVETHSGTHSNHTQALLLLHDEHYHQVKAMIMKPINEFYDLMSMRTQASLRKAENSALIFRLLFLFIALGTTFMLWRFYAVLHATLGSSANEIHALMSRIGHGNFSTAIIVPPDMENSVIAGLSRMQDKLHVLEIAHKKSEEQLRIAATFFESQEAMMITDAKNIILRVNQAFTRITGYTAEETVGQTPRMLQSGRHSEDFYREMWETITRTGGWQGEIWDRRKNGEVYPKWLTLSAVRSENGAVTHYVAMHSDITEHKKTEAKIRELAFFDQLTGLPNRTLLLDRLQQAKAASIRSGSYGALLLIDLDNFKTLNDTLGHDMGDLLLRQVAQRLTTCVRAVDTVARLGGDEFVVMLESLSMDERSAATQTEAVGEKILASLNQIYQLNKINYRNTPSIGATLFRGHQTTIDHLMKQADLAMYKSKETGRNVMHFFDADMEAVVMGRAALEKDLHLGIQEKQFLLYFQAQIVGKNRLTGAEALVRWQHPKRGMISPDEFIPLVEETELILPLGRWIMEAACTQLAAWATRPEMAHLKIAVNVSARQLHQPDFVDQLLAILKNTGANPQRLELELTESLLITNREDIIEKMFTLKAHGVSFSLDDFGTGFSSLTYLKHLPLDKLKIDRSFVRDVLTDPNDASITKTIIALAQNLGLGVMAEGVETAEQRDFLARAGCHAYQGFFFSHPTPVESFELLVQSGITPAISPTGA